MTTSERLSGAQSAARIIGRSKWPAVSRCLNANDEPCKFPECHCAETGLVGLPVLDTMTDDRFNLHRVDASQLGPRDGVAIGGCRTDLPIQFAENETTGLIASIKRDAFWLKWWAAAIGGGLLVALVIYASTK